MHIPKRDMVATGLVAVAGVLYLLWAFEAAGLTSTRAVGIAVLGLGFAASASAVVPNFDQLLHGNKLYLAVTSILGVVALIAGIQMLVTASGTALGVLMGTMCLMWIIATVHHIQLAQEAAGTPLRGPRASSA